MGVCPGGLCPGGVCPGQSFSRGSLSRGVSVRGVSVQGCLCLGEVSVQGGLWVFVDFKKAFDYTDRDLLYCRLLNYGVTGKMLNIIQAMYQNSVNAIRVNGKLSNPFESKNGVKQGDNASPLCFNLFINHLICELKKCKIGIEVEGTIVNTLEYADGIALIAKNPHDMQVLLDKLNNWCTKWFVKVNAEKTKVVHFRKKAVKQSEQKLYIGTDNIDYIDKYKYLGMTLGCHMDMDVITENLSCAASRALSQIISKTRSNYDLSYKSFTTLFNSCVVPILD